MTPGDIASLGSHQTEHASIALSSYANHSVLDATQRD
jgi:hypothetical protein